MWVSLRWLNQIFPSGLTVDALVQTLTMAGLEVESVADLGMQSGRIVVARVAEISKHPEADKLHLVKADVGDERLLNIVCGAGNLVQDMLVPCALVGAELPGDVKIKKAKIRGQESEGMLCSAKELNLGMDHSGILSLPDTCKPGEPFDCVLDIKITPNRADCLSLIGIARDLAAMLGKKKTFPTTYRFTETLGQTTEQFINLSVPERGACPRYTCRHVNLKDQTPGPSPLWLSRPLEISGYRSINNIVDVTNYVMLELGIPLHAFDYGCIRGGKIIVRFARAGESLETLDDRVIQLHAEDLVIADAERPIALAGVMGGKNTQITSSTTAIVLECAYFDSATIRKTARRHGFQTDSSYRFERGVDRARVHVSLARATQLIQELTHANVSRGFLDVQATMMDQNPITLNVSHLNHLLGLELSNQDVADRLVNLGFEVRRSDRESLAVAPPSYRVDIERDVDLIEEVARLYGYDKIPETMPGIPPRKGREDLTRPRLLRSLRSALVSLGFSEAINFSFTSEETASRLGYNAALQPHLANPLTQDQAILRPAILPDLIKTAGYNQRQGAERVALFEIGKTFAPNARVGHEEDEGLSLAMILGGLEPSNWARPERLYDFHDLKGILEVLGEQLGLGRPQADVLEPGPTYHPGRSASISWEGERVGAFGELHPDLALVLDLRGRVHAAELDLARVLNLASSRRPQFRPIPRFPSSERDLALVVDQSLSAEALSQSAMKLGRPLVEDLSIVDLYTGQHVPEGKKSLALRFHLRKPDATLTDDEINSAMERIASGLKEQFGATLRV